MLEGTFNQSRSRWHSLWLWNLREPTFEALNYTPPPPSLCPALTYRPDYEVPTLLTCQHNYPIFVQIYKQPAAAWQVCDSVTCHECVMRPISDCPHWLLAAWRGDTADGDIGHGDNSPGVTQSWGNYLNPTGFLQNYITTLLAFALQIYGYQIF